MSVVFVTVCLKLITDHCLFWGIEMPPEIDYEKCIACGDCRERCSEDVFFDRDSEGGQGETKPLVTYPEACYHCHLCADGCPVGAIAIRTPLVMHVPYK